MLSRLSRLTSRRSAAAPLRLAAARALSIESFKGVSHPLVPGVGQPKNIQKEDYMHADMVLEEEKTGFPPGLPLKRDSEIWQNPQDPNQLLAERAEMWWDDGTAEPEWFVDRGSPGGIDGGRPWAVSNGMAVAQLMGMFGCLAAVMGVCWLVDDKFAYVAPRATHGFPMDMHKLQGTSNIPLEGKSASNQRRWPQHGVEVEEEEE